MRVGKRKKKNQGNKTGWWKGVTTRERERDRSWECLVREKRERENRKTVRVMDGQLPML